ncbi:C2H2 finger domain protein, putative [Talaromyces stipitatus ATCC 10500]|uniref:C2H2 finger domain protein, putative n=1 Tax=Talaromyces stipitatus (strain ATCC 10500 / CBS 375.48 / QM 6759 / NRRL 1006) TaxID=441959 RepID=B8M3W7_TALSN|nr:C2H2 finger domain protein, putative [Talaromyces stipitatus ATCC 10500]EED20710.1 C2H2 finger domain protein, putative [Talaromyces stipitatus ATCC 10500]
MTAISTMADIPRDHAKHNSESKKRKRNRKAQPDKKFECQHEGCGKSYSRAEHLHRHQLNHTPKQIYRCDFPDCYRSFVRQDLCIRHRERHTTHGSQLQKRDSFTQAAGRANVSSSPQSLHAPDDPSSAVLSPTSQTSKPMTAYDGLNGSKDAYPSVRYGGNPGIGAKTQRMYGSGTAYGSNFQGNSFSPNALRDTNTTNSGYINSDALNSPTAYMSHQGLMPDLGYSGSELPQTTAYTTSMNVLGSVSAGMVPESTGEGELFDSSLPYPVFGGESSYNRSPFAMADDFAAWLFSEPTGTSPVNYSNMITGYTDLPQTNPISFIPNDTSSFNGFPSSLVSHPMSVTNIVDSTPPEAMMSEEKRQDLLHLISTRFNETAHSAVNTRKDSLMEGNIDADGHILSLRMMQTYVGSYWLHFHAQLPILHRPTFVADRTPSLLLLSLMAIGAATLEKMHGQSVIDAAAELANFLAWHIRWEIFMDVDFRPPAKLWVFQTLLLLEIYEKGYSTRALHERAHIHHDTTLTLMRRGSSFLGRSAYDTPASSRDERVQRSMTSATDVSEREDPWSYWIRTEATRRVAFGAFLMDSIHSTMFGHSVKMVAHELRLPLPCDEALWSAGSAAEVSRMQTVLQSNGVKPTMFLDGLKKTLTGQKVRTNAFGRTILIAGLLSVSWHMNQRDLQVSSLGVTQALGGRDKWRASLLRAFDNWKHDYDDALAESGHRVYSKNSPSFYQQHHLQFQIDEDDTHESRTVLHHLAHIATHVDIVDCQIFAGASRLLSRSITPKDYSTAREKMTERWATKASARDATFYALKFLSHVLLPSPNPRGDPSRGGKPPGYSAVDDFLLHRSWVVYFSALVVWSYGYALEGPIPSPPELSSEAAQLQDMQRFLQTVGAVHEPNDLEHVTGRNQCLGLLLHLRSSFLNTRWELLHEAALLLDSCVEKLKSPGR